MLFFITFVLISLSVVSASDVAQDNNMTDSVTSTSSVETDYENSNTQSNVIENDTVSSNDISNAEDNTSYNNVTQTDNTEETTAKQITKTNNTTIKTDSNKISSTIIIDEILFAGKDNSVNISAIIKDQYGRTINSGKVAFKVSGITIDTVNIVNSKASIIYPATNLSKEYYVFNVVYGGSSTIQPCRVNTTLKVLSNLSVYSFSQIGEAATRVKTFIENNKRLPNYITVGSDRVDPEDFFYMLTRTISDKSSVANGYFSSVASVNNTNCSGMKIYQDEFLYLADNIVSYYAQNKVNPSSVTAYNSTVSYQDAVYLFTRIVAYTYTNGNKPNYGVVVDITGDTTIYDYENTSSSTDTKQYVDITLGSYEAYPNTTKTISAAFVYGNSTKVDGVKCVFKVNALTVGTTTINNGVATLTFNVPNWGAKDYTLEVKIGETSNSYQSSAQSTFTVLSTKSSSNTSSSTSTDTSSSTTYSTKIILDEVYFAKSTNNQATLTIKVLDNEGNLVTGGKTVLKINDVTMDTQTVNNGVATFTYDASDLSTAKTHDVDIIYGGTSKYNSSRNSSYLRVSSTLYKVTYEQVLKAANNTKTFIEANNRLPNYVTVGDYQVSIVDYLYLIGQTVTSNTSYYSPQFSSYIPTTTTNCYGKNLSKAQYIQVANNYIDSLIKTAKLPSKFTNDVGNISFADTVYLMTRAVAYIYNNGILPAYSMILESTVTAANITDSISGNTVSDAYQKYLAVTDNCEVNSTYIKNAVAKAISGVSGSLNQAKAIFNYVNNVTSYLYYSNTRYGAIKTLTLGYGNCVDTTHALIAMFRTANLPARYVHGKNCVFRSGLLVGHVWAEVYVGGTWYKCDASSNYNSFNNIVNWNGNSGEVRYIELPF